MAQRHSVQLKVASPRIADVFRDTVRIHSESRGGLPSGSVYGIQANGRFLRQVIRGSSDIKPGIIYMDEHARDFFGVKIDEEVDFYINKEGFFGNLALAWNATDPAYGICAQLGVLGFVLGFLSIIISILSFIPR